MGASKLNETLHTYILDTKKTLEYVNWNLEGLNALSEAVLANTPFLKGEFYTFLRKEISDEQLYGFKYGGVGGGVSKRVIDFVYKEISNIGDLFCIFDDYDQDYKPDYQWDLFNRVGVHYGKEMYYLVQWEGISTELLLECFQAGDCIWHSLIVLSRLPFIKRSDKSITEDEIKQIAKSAEYVLLRAYDQEGYIIWKRTNM